MGRRGGGGGVSLSVNVDSPAIVFAILHGITLLIYTGVVFAEPSAVYLFLVLFGATRVADFGIRAVAEDPNTPNGVVYTGGALFVLGFFALLYSAYSLVLDRGVVSGIFAKRMITQIIRNVVRLLLAIGVVVGIPAWPYYIQAADLIDFAVTYYSRASDQGRFNSLVDEAAGLRDKAFVFVEVTVYTFLIITGLLAIHTVVLLSWERARLERRSVNGQPTDTGTTWPYAIYMPSLITIALLTRSIYATVAINDVPTDQSKLAFYLLGALPEWLALLFFAFNDVVPKRKDVVPPIPDREKDSVAT